ncbi:MAG: SDR family oxidoreductase, partial [Tissierellia bacterium]|nr:SDR family oxidoreductase [Tissierellia bacterium]
KDYPELYAKTIQGVPMGRFADPEKDIGRLCIFLSSDGKYITGETISVQGGSGLRP